MEQYQQLSHLGCPVSRLAETLSCASAPKSPPEPVDGCGWEQRCPFAGAWPHSPQWALAQGHLHKPPAPVTQLQGGTVKQITLNFSRFLDSPVCQKTNLEASYVSNHCVCGMWNISNLRSRAWLHILYKHTQTPCGNNMCIYDGDLCFLYYFRILSGFETIVKSISFSLLLLTYS